jgi:hypothetical protein
LTTTTESVRKDSRVRQIEQKQIIDWSGKRVILPRGTTLPAVGVDGEMFIKIVVGGHNKLLTWDEGVNNWTTVGPQV